MPISKNMASIEKPKNIILFIIDGLGFEHLSLLDILQEEDQNYTKNFKSGWHSNQSEGSYLTDSAASATALSTGYKTSNSSIGVDKEGNKLKNLIEKAIEHGMKTGVVTDTYFWDATPAAFTSHASTRDSYKQIIQQQANSKVDLLIGEISKKSPYSKQEIHEIFNKYITLSDVSSQTTHKPTAVLLPYKHFHNQNSPKYFSKVVEYSINHLQNKSSNRFLLILETEEIDSSSHRNDNSRLIAAMHSINHTLTLLTKYITKNPDSLVLVTSDHSTGALALIGSDNNTIKINWSSEEHTRSLVPILTSGKSSNNFAIPTTNNRLGQLLHKLI